MLKHAATGRLHGRDSSAPKMVALRITLDQRKLILNAIKTLRLRENDLNISEGRALELMAASYLSEPGATA